MSTLPHTYDEQLADYRPLVMALGASARPGEPIVMACPDWRYGPQVLYLAVSHYNGPPVGRVLLLDHPASPTVVAELGRPPVVWMLADPYLAFQPGWLPGYHQAIGNSWRDAGALIRVDRDPS